MQTLRKEPIRLPMSPATNRSGGESAKGKASESISAGISYPPENEGGLCSHLPAPAVIPVRVSFGVHRQLLQPADFDEGFEGRRRSAVLGDVTPEQTPEGVQVHVDLQVVDVPPGDFPACRIHRRIIGDRAPRPQGGAKVSLLLEHRGVAAADDRGRSWSGDRLL